jgi:hypothetical protein
MQRRLGLVRHVRHDVVPFGRDFLVGKNDLGLPHASSSKIIVVLPTRQKCGYFIPFFRLSQYDILTAGS